MRRFMVRVLPVLVLVLVVSPLLAQRQPGRFGGGGLGQLLTNKGVQEELKLSDDQKSKLTKGVAEAQEKYGKDMRAAFMDKDQEKVQKLTKEMNSDLHKLAESALKPEQAKRLHQIELQFGLQRGNLEALSSAHVQKELKFTDKQKEMLKETSEMLAKERVEMLKDIRDREKFQEAQKKLADKAKGAVEKLAESLSADQKKAWKDLTGEKFEVKLEPRRPPQ